MKERITIVNVTVQYVPKNIFKILVIWNLNKLSKHVVKVF